MTPAGTDTTRPSREKGWWLNHGILVLTILYFLALLPILPKVSAYHDDERFYTDAAIIMVQSGDYLSPYYPTGELRSKKPIIVYWMLAASYKLFGINYFASRLPFLIAGCLVVWLTFRMALSLFHRRSDALVAAAIIASNITLFTSSVRSTPDILLCLFVCVSLYGFINIIFERDRSVLNYLLAYMGAALAVESKGFLGLTPVIFAFAFCFFRKKRTGVGMWQLVHVKIMAAAVLAAVAWFVVLYINHGDAALMGFFSDQAGKRFSGSKLYILVNIVNYTWGLVRHFLPWSAFLIAGLIWDRRVVVDFYREHKEKFLFICGWYLMLLVMFLSGNINRTRYLLPAYPLLSILFAVLLVRLVEKGRIAGLVRGTHRVLLVTAGVCAILLIPAGVLIDARIAAGGALLLVIAAAMYYLSIARRKLPVMVALGVFIMLLLSTAETFIRPVFRVSPAPALADCILSREGGNPTVTSIWYPDKYAGQLRVFSHGRIEVESIPKGPVPKDALNRKVLILSEKAKNELDLKGYTVERCGYSYRPLKIGDIWEMITKGDREAVFLRLRKYDYLAFKND